jgi:hypothetical protein
MPHTIHISRHSPFRPICRQTCVFDIVLFMIHCKISLYVWRDEHKLFDVGQIMAGSFMMPGPIFPLSDYFKFDRQLPGRVFLGIALFTAVWLNSCTSANPSPVASPSPTSMEIQTPSPELTIAPSPFFTPSPSIPPCKKPSTWQIQFRRSGGIGGQNYLLELSDDGKLNVTDEKTNLSRADVLSRQALNDFEQKLLSACPYFKPGKSNPKPRNASCPDCFTYTLDVRLDQKDFSVSIPDGDPIPFEIQEFLKAINQLLGQFTP